MNKPIVDLEKRILFDQDGLLVIDKPYDLPSTGKTLEDDDCLQFWLMKHFDQKIWAVHQLDADTTGINLFVKEKKLVAHYKELLGSPDTNKEYLAFVHGSPSWESIDEYGPIGYLDETNLGICDTGKSAHSHFECMKRSKGRSLIKVRIYTGRTHQIRIHLSHLGHPVIGEEWYCDPPSAVHYRQALHASKLKLANGWAFAAPFPEDLMFLLRNDQ